ncbi:hypothetical protein [[Eubacterium] hominis]|uniref:hypothetical protein n=1 Tax=[Eubacterium] hominis TaxID=2764325 RepID=UPI003A4DA65F
MKKNDKSSNNNKNIYMVFYVLTVLLVLYLGYTLVVTYQQLGAYCENYNTTMAAQWSYCLQAFLAAAVPCLVYASTCYGIGYLIKNNARE